MFVIILVMGKAPNLNKTLLLVTCKENNKEERTQSTNDICRHLDPTPHSSVVRFPHFCIRRSSPLPLVLVRYLKDI